MQFQAKRLLPSNCYDNGLYSGFYPSFHRADAIPQRIYLDAKFPSLAEFNDSFSTWMDEYCQPFRVASSELLRETDGGLNEECCYRYLVYHCAHYGVPRKRGSGMRPNQSYMAKGCTATIRVNYSYQDRCLKITTLKTEHEGHEISPVAYNEYTSKIKKTGVLSAARKTNKRVLPVSPDDNESSTPKQKKTKKEASGITSTPRPKKAPVRKERKSTKKTPLSPVNYSTSAAHDETTALSPTSALPDSTTTTSALEAFIDGVIDDNSNNNNNNNNNNVDGGLEVHEATDPEDTFIDVESMDPAVSDTPNAAWAPPPPPNLPAPVPTYPAVYNPYSMSTVMMQPYLITPIYNFSVQVEPFDTLNLPISIPVENPHVTTGLHEAGNENVPPASPKTFETLLPPVKREPVSPAESAPANGTPFNLPQYPQTSYTTLQPVKPIAQHGTSSFPNPTMMPLQVLNQQPMQPLQPMQSTNTIDLLHSQIMNCPPEMVADGESPVTLFCLLCTPLLVAASGCAAIAWRDRWLFFPLVMSLSYEMIKGMARLAYLCIVATADQTRFPTFIRMVADFYPAFVEDAKAHSLSVSWFREIFIIVYCAVLLVCTRTEIALINSELDEWEAANAVVGSAPPQLPPPSYENFHVHVIVPEICDLPAFSSHTEPPSYGEVVLRRREDGHSHHHQAPQENCPHVQR
ncbi:hypothetical protein PRIPAC_75110 [Pristionchus pacificus]|uniref:Uncharacterized protein n=1 Tax=Pristionchus pacificus TaxID=54126 RepID=A0A2A6C8N5_PRIPA|nr:hypothetical protein PRIPAC_75110 [Pristionchus pacificus]|eukprot:PDM74575.1 hypothetical protein PRIPAC_41931 [Pristionchus pacificus]